MKRKLIPPFWMLLAGAACGVIMLVFHYEAKPMLLILLGVLLGFYVIGCLYKFMLDLFEKQNEPVPEEKEIVAEEDQLDLAEETDEGQMGMNAES